MRWILYMVLLAHFVVFVDRADAQVTLEWRSFSQGPFFAGQTLNVRLIVIDNESEPVAGFQAFLEYDDTKLDLLSISYTPSPFGLHILDPIPLGTNTIDLAAGIDIFAGQSPVPPGSPRQTLVLFTFQVLEDSVCFPLLRFRDHGPPTRVTNPLGVEILPLTLVGETSGGQSDIDGNGVVDGFDLLELLSQWGPCPGNEVCSGDLDCNRTVDGFDLLLLLSDWGPV